MRLFFYFFLLFAISSQAYSKTCLKLFSDIPEINQAKNISTSTQRLSKKMLEENSTEHLARLLIKRHKKLFEEGEAYLNAKSGVNYMNKKVKLALAIRDQELFKLLESEQKEFLNYHQTQTTNGYSESSSRRKIEDRHLSLELGNSDKANELRPKSSYLFLGKQFENQDLGHTNIRQSYGDMFAVMKNEVKERSLFALHDSLAAFPLYSFAIKPEKPLAATKDLLGDYSAYFEALIYGRLQLKDVDYWLVNYTKQELKEVLDPNLDTALMYLLRSGQKVYLAKPLEINGRRELTKGSLIKTPTAE